MRLLARQELMMMMKAERNKRAFLRAKREIRGLKIHLPH